MRAPRSATRRSRKPRSAKTKPTSMTLRKKKSHERTPHHGPPTHGSNDASHPRLSTGEPLLPSYRRNVVPSADCPWRTNMHSRRARPAIEARRIVMDVAKITELCVDRPTRRPGDSRTHERL